MEDPTSRLVDILLRVEKLYFQLCAETGRRADSCLDCESRAVCNYAGLAPAYCEDHAAFDMDRQISVGAAPLKKGLCNYMCMNTAEGARPCGSRAKFGLVGHSPDRCHSHCGIGYIAHPLRRCQWTADDHTRDNPKKCTRRAVAGGTFEDGHAKCLDHKDDRWDRNESVSACLKCGLPTRWYESICLHCDSSPARRPDSYPRRQAALDKALRNLSGDDQTSGWHVLEFMITPTSAMKTLALRNGNRVVVAEYADRYTFSEDLEMIPRVLACRDLLAQDPNLQMAFLFVSCGTYRSRKQKKIAWSGALKETIEMTQSLMANPALWHRLSYAKLFHNDYVRGWTFDRAEQIILY